MIRDSGCFPLQRPTAGPQSLITIHKHSSETSVFPAPERNLNGLFSSSCVLISVFRFLYALCACVLPPPSELGIILGFVSQIKKLSLSDMKKLAQGQAADTW